MTAIGPCYVPPVYSIKSPEKKKPSRDERSQLNRADDRHVLKESNNTISVLIVGDQSLSEDFQKEIEKNFPTILPNKSLICVCAANPAPEEVSKADFFIFLVHLDNIYSIPDTKSRIKNVLQHIKYLSYKSLIVGISITGNAGDQCAPSDDYQNMLVEFQIPSHTFSYINRERKRHVLNNIITTINDRSDETSSKALITWGLSCPIASNDLVLS